MRRRQSRRRVASEGAVSPLGISCGRFAGHMSGLGALERRYVMVAPGESAHAVRAVARCGTRRFATLTPRATRHYLPGTAWGKGQVMCRFSDACRSDGYAGNLDGWSRRPSPT